MKTTYVVRTFFASGVIREAETATAKNARQAIANALSTVSAKENDDGAYGDVVSIQVFKK